MTSIAVIARHAAFGSQAALILAAGLVMSWPGPAVAQDVAAFYKGRTVQAVVGYPPVSTFEVYLRLFSRHASRHIPGNPTIVIQHMPGAGSLTATNYLAHVAPKDGSVIGMPNPVNTIEPLLDPQRSKFDPRTFNWIGNFNSERMTCCFWAKDVKTLDDMRKRELTMGSTGPAAGTTIDTLVVRHLLKLNVKLITGYRGLTDIKLASERGELDGFCGIAVSTLKSEFREPWRTGALSVALQMGLTRHPELPDVPNAYDQVTSEEDKQLFRLLFGPWSYGRSVLAPPGTPADRVAALRAAFKATVADPELIAEAKRLNVELNPTDGEAVAQLIGAILGTPEPVVARARTILGVDKR